MKIIFDDQRGIKKKEELTQSNNTRYIDEAIIGYEYHAILCTPQTTLEALNHHRERVYSTPANKLPVYGYPKNYQGNWLPLFANKKYNTHTTSKEQKELEFLKKFRKVYESDLVQDQKHEIISSLLKEYHGHPLQKLAADWHLWDLMEIPGISDSISKILFIEGIKSKQDVKMASDNALLNISGIGPSRLRQIRAFFQEIL